MSMKLYHCPLANTCRPILLLIADHGIHIDEQVVDLVKGEHLQEAYASVNPNCLVPFLVDGDLQIAESSAILKYLAERFELPVYPKELKAKARVNSLMDWFNTGFYREFGYHLIYPQVLDHHKRSSADVNRSILEWGQARARAAFEILDRHYLKDGPRYLVDDTLSVADYFGVCLTTAGDLVGNSLDPYPNVKRWVESMRERPSWSQVNEPFQAWVRSVTGPRYVTAQA
jgi:glutathione S-transferase